MLVKVAYEGITLADAAEARSSAAGLFVALAAPMPVGTRLRIEHGGSVAGAAMAARVSRVQETGEVSVFVVAESGGALSLDGESPTSALAGPTAPAQAHVDAPVAATTPADPEAFAIVAEAEDAPPAAAPVAAAPAQLILEVDADADEDAGPERENSNVNGAASEAGKNGEADSRKSRRRRRKPKA